jgi:hypothetical protein
MSIDFAYILKLSTMPNRLRLFFLLAFACGSVLLTGQVPMGKWRTHLPYQFCTLSEATDNKVFCASTGGLFFYKLDDNSVEKISKVDGLSDNGVSAMRWTQESETLILAYLNSNIDIIRGETVVNIPDIMKKQIPGDKSIYDIFYIGQTAYLSTGFGIVVLNLEKEEISETYYIGDLGNALKVNQVSSDGTYLYAATDQGIRMGLLDDPFLVDFNAWERVDDIPDPGGAFSNIASFNQTLFTSHADPAGQQDQVYYNSGSTWIPYPYFTGKICYEILNQGEYLTLVDDTVVNLINDDLLVVSQLEGLQPRSASIDDNGDLWLASFGSGLITNQGGNKWSITPNGPSSISVFDMEASQNILHAVQGGVTTIWGNSFRSASLQTFQDQQWSTRNNWDDRDLVTLALDPADPMHVYAGSWGWGLVEFTPQEINRYTETNSSLQTIMPGNFVRIGGVVFDPGGNLWMTNANVSEPISVLKPDGTWKSFSVDNLLSGYNTLGDVLVNQAGHLWAIVPRGFGLFAMDYNLTVDDTSDDLYRKVSVEDRFGKVITNDVRSFAEDQNGNLWLGTNQGVLVMYSPYRLFTDGELYAQAILIPRRDGSGLADPLLGTQIVSTIAVDGANRKWLGTSGGGVYLVSEDGLNEIHHFNSMNSPLLSDNLINICVDGITGEVFFGTDKGIISFKGDALAGSTMYNNVVVYPNPVRETYEGPVAIKGLVAKTNVKITDIGGNLVFETESLGGQAIWDGTNFQGNRVATGVYMIYLSSPDGSLSHVTKLLFIH